MRNSDGKWKWFSNFLFSCKACTDCSADVVCFKLFKFLLRLLVLLQVPVKWPRWWRQGVATVRRTKGLLASSSNCQVKAVDGFDDSGRV